MSLENFNKALRFTLKWEGGFVDHPSDKGGQTNQGITQKTYDEFRKSRGYAVQSVKNLTSEERDSCYYTNYWQSTEASHKPIKLGIACFDWAVNSGPKIALRYYDPNLEKYLINRMNFYKSIGVGQNSGFLRGWLNRVVDLQKYLQEI